jgi:hypothetical protein
MTTILIVGSGGPYAITPRSTATWNVGAWGAGQNGSNASPYMAGSSAGYSQRSISAVINQPIKFQLGGVGTTPSAVGGDTWFSSTAEILAPGGGSNTIAAGTLIYPGAPGGATINQNGVAGGGGAAGPNGAGQWGGNVGGNALGTGGAGGGGNGTASQSIIPVGPNIGVTTGVLPSPGVLPQSSSINSGNSNWFYQLGTGLVITIVGFGVANGRSYLEVNFNGICTDGSVKLFMGASPASASTVYKFGQFFTLTAGTFTNVNGIDLAIDAFSGSLGSGTYLSTPMFNQVTTTLSAVPTPYSREQPTPSGTTYVLPYVVIETSTTAPVNFTVRFSGITCAPNTAVNPVSGSNGGAGSNGYAGTAGAGGTVGSVNGQNGGPGSGGGGGYGDEVSVDGNGGKGGDDYVNGGGGGGGGGVGSYPTTGSGGNGGTPGGGGGATTTGANSLGGFAMVSITYPGSDPDQIYLCYDGVSTLLSQITIPSNWSSVCDAMAWGPGGRGGQGAASVGSGGASSGGFSRKYQLPVTPGSALTGITLQGPTTTGTTSAVSIGSSLIANGGVSPSGATGGSAPSTGTGDVALPGIAGSNGQAASSGGGGGGGGAAGPDGVGGSGSASSSGNGGIGGTADAGLVAGSSGGVNNGTATTGPGTAGISDTRGGSGGGGGGHNTTAANALGGAGGFPGGGAGGSGAGNSGGTFPVGGAGLIILTQVFSIVYVDSTVPVVRRKSGVHRAFPHVDTVGPVNPFVVPPQRGWPIQPPQPPQPRTKRAGSIAKGNDGIQAAFVVVMPSPFWSVEAFTIPHFRRSFTQESEAGDEATFAGPPGPDISTTQVDWSAGFVPFRNRLAHPSALMPLEAGIELPFSASYPNGWPIQSFQPPHPRPERSGLLPARTDDTFVSPYLSVGPYCFIPSAIGQMQIGISGVGASTGLLPLLGPSTAQEFQIPHATHANRAGSFADGDKGIQAVYKYATSMGWQIQQSQPLRSRLEEQAGILAGQNNIETLFWHYYPMGWESVLLQPKHPRPELFGAIRAPFDVDALFNLFSPMGWEIGPPPTIKRPMYRAIAPMAIGDMGIEAAFISVRVSGWAYDSPFLFPRKRFNVIPPSEDGIEFYHFFNPFAWEVTPPYIAHPRPERSGVQASGYLNIDWKYLAPPLPYSWEIGPPVANHPRPERSGMQAGAFLDWQFLPGPYPFAWEVAPPYLHPRTERSGVQAVGIVNIDGIILEPPPPIGYEPWIIPYRRRYNVVTPQEDGIELPIVPVRFVGWEATLLQPNHPRPERSGVQATGDVGIEYSLIIPFKQGWPIQSFQPPHPRPEKAGVLFDGYQRLAGLIQIPPYTYFGWPTQDPQPPHPLPEKAGMLFGHDDGTQDIQRRFFDYGWPVQPWQPPHPRPEKASVLFGGDSGIQFTFVPRIPTQGIKVSITLRGVSVSLPSSGIL